MSENKSKARQRKKNNVVAETNAPDKVSKKDENAKRWANASTTS